MKQVAFIKYIVDAFINYIYGEKKIIGNKRKEQKQNHFYKFLLYHYCFIPFACSISYVNVYTQTGDCSMIFSSQFSSHIFSFTSKYFIAEWVFYKAISEVFRLWKWVFNRYKAIVREPANQRTPSNNCIKKCPPLTQTIMTVIETPNR